MRSLLIACMAVGLALTAGMACAAQPGQVSDSTLAQLGLSGMQQMSDVQGTAIRGSGFASVSGTGFAVAGGDGALAGQVSCFNAKSCTCNASASGWDVAAAAKVNVSLSCKGLTACVNGAVAFGAASACAK